MECAGEGLGTRCTGPPTRRCAGCGAVAYCSVSHQIAHWPDQKEECGRLERHMKHMDILNEFPFTFTQQATVQPLTIYYATQVAGLGSWTSGISNKLYIHYLGPEKELLRLSVFSELRALFSNMNMHIELVGPSIPQHRDGEMVALSNYAHCLDRDCICKSSSETVSGDVHTSEPSAVTLHLRRGFYHDHYMDITKDSSPHLVIAPNAGIAAYSGNRWRWKTVFLFFLATQIASSMGCQIGRRKIICIVLKIAGASHDEKEGKLSR